MVFRRSICMLGLLARLGAQVADDDARHTFLHLPSSSTSGFVCPVRSCMMPASLARLSSLKLTISNWSGLCCSKNVMGTPMSPPSSCMLRRKWSKLAMPSSVTTVARLPSIQARFTSSRTKRHGRSAWAEHPSVGTSRPYATLAEPDFTCHPSRWLSSRVPSERGTARDFSPTPQTRPRIAYAISPGLYVVVSPFRPPNSMALRGNESSPARPPKFAASVPLRPDADSILSRR